ncbi:hypothetical protein GDO86_001287 [Hymenochirus boettgeri]|nr:hypothetical protein GDO86_001287 [Hymenochirus boettgeri]KAG8455009.1 hypothetical protein GDO86_001287 [Hymenochirus boettgeri]
MRLKNTAFVTHFGRPKATLRQPGINSPQERVVRKPLLTNPHSKGNILSGWTVDPPLIPQLLESVPVQKHPQTIYRTERNVLPPRFQKEINNTPLHKDPMTDSNANNTHNCRPAAQTNISVIHNNLRVLLEKNKNGIWLSKLTRLYKETYKQDLGDQVLKQVPNWTNICTARKIVSSGQTEIVLYSPTTVQHSNSQSFEHRSNDHPKPNVPLDQSKSPIPPMKSSGSIAKVELKQNILQILIKYNSGLWYHALPKIFEDMFKQKFPKEEINFNFLSEICTIDLICKEPLKAILYAKSTEMTDQNSNSSCNTSIPKKVQHIESSCLSADTETHMTPPPLIIPFEASPTVLVVELNNTNDVVIRYIGQDYSAAQERMEDKLKEFCSKIPTAQVGSIKIGQLVAVKADEDSWLRAQISHIEDHKIKVCYMDYGFCEVVDITKICPLGKQFYTLPFQATKCRLAGLEAFCDDTIIIKALESKACGKILAVEILQKSEKPLVVLYDTSGEGDVNINAACLKELYDRSLSLKLKVNSSYSNVIVTNVCSDGSLFCQIPSKSLAKLCKTMQLIESEFKSKHITSDIYVSLPFSGKICLFDCRGKLARVEITSVHSSRALDVQFLDSGTIASIKVSELREIPHQFLRDIISIPPQAVRCCLADVPLGIGIWTPDSVLWLRNTVLNCPECSIKVVKLDETLDMAHVYLFTQNNISDVERSVNRQITNEELRKHHKDLFPNLKPGVAQIVKGRDNIGAQASEAMLAGTHKEQTSVIKKNVTEQSNTVPPLELPPVLRLPKYGEHMDVFVSVACHPGHFVVQPWQELHNLEVVMEEMLIHYSTTEEKLVHVEKNKLYAAKIENKWYRVLVKGILMNGLVSVYELDFGKHELVSCQNIQLLITKFMHLPFQAVTCQLAGVKCELRSEEASIVFRNNVEKKPHVALYKQFRKVLIHGTAKLWLI